MSHLWPLHVFSPEEGYAIVERRLPHWSQAGAICFITWRTHDSIPGPVLRRWHADRDRWLQQHGIGTEGEGWKQQLQSLDSKLRREFLKTFSERWHKQLDTCHGSCVLRDPILAAVIKESLLKFDHQRYLVTDFIVMPNHVHLLVSFKREADLLKQCEGWKHFQAREINRKRGTKGRFWQQDGFDHLVRSEAQFASLQRYIAQNPQRAHLKPGEYLHYSVGLGNHHPPP